MRKCMSCLAEILDTSIFCKKCGAKVTTAPEVLPRVKRKCPGKDGYCGNELDADDMFCDKCGLKVDQSMFENPDSHSITKGKETDLADCQGQGQDKEVKTETAKEELKPPMLEAVSSTSDCPAKFGEDDSEPDTLDSQPDSLMSEESREKTALGGTTEGNKPKKKKKKKKKKNSSKFKCDKEAENVAEQTTNASADDRRSDESRVDQKTKINVSVQESSSDMSKTVSDTNTQQQTVDKQLCNENNGQLTVSQDVSISESDMEKPASDADKENNQAIKIDQSGSSISESGIKNPVSNAVKENNHMKMDQSVSSKVASGDKTTLEMQQQSDSAQNRSDENEIFYPPNLNDNNSSATDTNKTHELETDGTSHEMVFGNEKRTDQLSVDKTDSENDEGNKTDNSTETKEHKLMVYPEFKKLGKKQKKKKKKNQISENKNVSQNDQHDDSQMRQNQPRITSTFGNEVEVVFHCIISDTGNNDPTSEDICMAFDPEVLHHWKTDKWKMTRIGQKKDYHEYSLSVMMSKTLRDKGFYYKYVFVKKDQTEFECVHFMQVRTKEDDPNRQFHLPFSSDKTSSDVWHQYDGFVYPKSSTSLWNKAKEAVKSLFKDFNEKVKSDTRKAAAHFLPSANEIIQSLKEDNSQVHAEELLRAIYNVMNSLKIQMIDLHSGSVDYNFFYESFGEIMKPLFQELSVCVESAGKNEISDHALSVAVFMLMIWKYNKIEKWSYLQYISTFFKALLLQADAERMSCPNYDRMKKNFPNKEKYILKALRELIEQHSDDTQNDSSWLYSLPLLHFLGGHSEPFKITESCEHQNDKWWGILGLESAKEKMKKKTEGYSYSSHRQHGYSYSNFLEPAEWSIPVQNIIGDLQHLFEVDYLLPRSIMATITMRQLENAISPGLIPPYIAAACLFYHCRKIKGTNYMNQLSRDLFIKLFKENADQFNERIEIELLPSISKSKLKQIMVELEMSKTIVKNLVQDNIPNDYFLSIIPLGLAVISGLANAHQLQTHVDDSESARANEDQKVLEYLEENAVKFLSQRHHFKLTVQHKKSIMIWNEMICLKIQANDMKQHWQKTLLEAFEKEISSLDTWICVKILELGIDSDSLFHNLKESLTSAAFHAFQKEMMETPNKTVPETKTYGRMMSKMFEKQWPTNETQEEMLHFVSTFRPMRQYFERFSVNYVQLQLCYL
ncbi:E3 ubiquitin-protein ligase rnf213-alpha-like [Gigantopelta aegis]|uniref:E3 ubiquitin-protein ligase rnf213-alpha-like n=1 Tax=Gigantopelta aegis TaxID=1735272 RepID=UPI001B88DB8C|nr:E3 ubiquitin-protein ligase rnf213-alpha-like [Gigantopelta aegis]